MEEAFSENGTAPEKTKLMKKYTVKTEWGTYDVALGKHAYHKPRTLAVQAACIKGGKTFATLTVNLDGYTGAGLQSDTRTFVDTNNCPWAEKFLRENGIAKPTGIVMQSGFCSYPLYEFDLSKLN